MTLILPPKEYWMIYRRPGSVPWFIDDQDRRMIWLLLHPSPLSCHQAVFLSQFFLCGRKGVWGAQSYDCVKAWSSKTMKSFNTLCCRPYVTLLNNRERFNIKKLKWKLFIIPILFDSTLNGLFLFILYRALVLIDRNMREREKNTRNANERDTK